MQSILGENSPECADRPTDRTNDSLVQKENEKKYFCRFFRAAPIEQISANAVADVSPM